MACKYLISRPFYFSGSAELRKNVHSSGVETETRIAQEGFDFPPADLHGFALLCTLKFYTSL